MLLFCIYCHVKCAFFVWVWACVWNSNHESNWLLRMLSLLEGLKIHFGKSQGLKMAPPWKASLAGLMRVEEKGLVFAMPLSCGWVCVPKGKRSSTLILFIDADVGNACVSLRSTVFGVMVWSCLCCCVHCPPRSHCRHRAPSCRCTTQA